MRADAAVLARRGPTGQPRRCGTNPTGTIGGKASRSNPSVARRTQQSPGLGYLGPPTGHPATRSCGQYWRVISLTPAASSMVISEVYLSGCSDISSAW